MDEKQKTKPDVPKRDQMIFLARHAKPELPPGARVYYGHTDYPLSEEGIARSKELGAAIKHIEFDRMYCSDLVRSKDSARFMLPDRFGSFEVKPSLREINMGDWEGRTFDEVRDKWSEIYEKRGKSFSTQAPPGGESFSDLQRRAVPAFLDLLEESPSGNILIVGHAAFIWTVMCALFAFDLDDMFFYPMNYSGLHLLHNSDGLMRLMRYNWDVALI